MATSFTTVEILKLNIICSANYVNATNNSYSAAITYDTENTLIAYTNNSNRVGYLFAIR